MNCSLEECIRRDPKGHHRRAMEGQTVRMTGIQAPYEPPERPEVVLDTERWPLDRCVEEIRRVVIRQGVPARPGGPEH